MSIKIGTDTVNDVVFKQGTTNYTVTLIKDSNGQYYYARPGVLDIKLGTGVAGYSALNRTVTLEPTASTGAISASSTIYHGDHIAASVTAATYWVPITHSCTVDLLNSTTYTTTLTAYRECNNATVKIGSNVASYKIQYSNSDGTAITTSSVTTATATYYAWRAAAVTITPTGATNYTCSPVTKAVGWTTFTQTLTATPWLYRLTIPNVAGANIKYFYHDGTSAKTNQTAEGVTVNAWKGHDAGYTWDRDTYYTLSGTTSTTWTVSGDYTIPAPTVSRYMKNVAVNLSHVTKASVSYATASGTTTVGVTSSTNVNAWTGAAVQWTSATAETNWTIAQSGSVGAGEGDRVLSISASRQMRTITIPNLADATVAYTYYNSSGTSTTGTAENTTVQAWQGQNFSYLWTRTPTYYTLSGTASGSFTVSTDTTIGKPSVVPYNRDVTVTVKPGIASIVSTYHSDPNNTVTTGTSQTSSYYAWTGGSFDWTATLQSYWTLSATSGSIAASESARSVAPTPTTVTANAQVIRGSNVDSYKIEYYNSTPTAVTTSGVTTTTANYTAWRGAQVKITPTPSTNYTVSPITKAVGWTAFTETLAATPWMYAITVPAQDNATIVYTYTNSSGGAVTGTAKNTSVSAWKGHNFSYQWTRATYWTLSGTTQGTFTVNAATTVTKPTVSRYMKDVTVQLSNVTSASVSYYNSSGTEVGANVTATTNVNAWTGQKVRWTSASAPANWTVAQSGNVAANENARTLTISASRVMHTITIPACNNATVAYTYSNSSGSSSTGTTKNTTVSAWQGHDFSYTWTRATFYTLSGTTNGSFTVSQATTIGSPSVSPWVKSVPITTGNGIDSIVVTYTTAAGVRDTMTVTTHGDALAWTGDTVKWSASTKNYWTLSPAGGTLDATEADRSIWPQGTRVTHNLTVSTSGKASGYNLSYIDGSGNAQSTSGTGSVTKAVWNGGNVTAYPSVPDANYTYSTASYTPIGTIAAITLSASCWTYSITIPNIANATVAYSYYNSDGTSTTGTAKNTSVGAWKGHNFSYTWTRASFYTISGGTSTGSFTVTQNTTIGAPSISPWVQSVSVKNNGGLSQIKVTYYTYPNASASTATISSATGSVSAWNGGTVDWVATISDTRYWSMSPTSGTLAASDSTRKVEVGATRITHNLTVSTSGKASGYHLEYVDGSGTSQTTVGTGSVTKTVWNGGNVTAYPTVPDSNYTYSVSSYTPIGTTAAITLSASCWTYGITVPVVAHANAWYSYYNSNGSAVTGDTAGTVGAWKGHNFVYIWAADPYYTITQNWEGSFTVSSSLTIPAAVIGCKTRKVYYSGTGSADLLYYDANGEYSCGSVSSSYISVWCGKVVTYTLPSSYNSLYYTNTTGTIAVQDTTSDYTITPNLRTFTLGTYTYGTITYYSDSSMTQTITSGNYNTIYNKAYYKYTRNGWYFALMSGSTIITYTNVLSGVVTTTPASTTSPWYGMASEPPAGNYAKVTVTSSKRGAVYYKPSTLTTYSKLSSGTLTSASSTVYMSSGTTYNLYANYIGYQGSLDGGSTATYGSATDNYTSSANPRNISINTSTITAAFNGSLKSRNIIVNRGAGTQFTATMSYINTSGVSTSSKIAGTDAFTFYQHAQTTYAVWNGCDVTLTHSTISSPWSISSGYNISSIAHGTSNYTLTLRTEYDYLLQNKSLSTTSSRYLSMTINYVSTQSYAVRATFGSSSSILLESPNTTTGNLTSGRLTTTTSGSYRYFTASKSSAGAIQMTAMGLRNSMVRPTWIRLDDDRWGVYNPYDTPMDIYGSITMNYPGGTSVQTLDSMSVAAGAYAETIFCNGASASSWEAAITIAVPGALNLRSYKEETFTDWE